MIMLKRITKTFLVALLFLSSQSAFAVVAVTGTTINSVATNDVTFSHNHPTGSDFVVVSIAHRYGAECLSGSTAVKYKGVNMTRTIATVANTGVYLYHIATSTSGSGNVIVDFCSGSVGRHNSVVVYSLSGVATSSPIGDTAFKNVGSGVYVNNLDATSTSAGSYFFNVNSAVGTLTKTGDQTLVSSAVWSGANSYAHAKLYASTSATVYDFDWSWTVNSGDGNGQVVAEYLPLSGPPVDIPTSTRPFIMYNDNMVTEINCTHGVSTSTCTNTFTVGPDFLFYGTIVFLLVFFGLIYYFKRPNQI